MKILMIIMAIIPTVCMGYIVGYIVIKILTDTSVKDKVMKNKYFDELLKLQKLKEKKIISEEEFHREKEKIKPKS